MGTNGFLRVRHLVGDSFVHSVDVGSTTTISCAKVANVCKDSLILLVVHVCFDPVMYFTGGKSVAGLMPINRPQVSPLTDPGDQIHAGEQPIAYLHPSALCRRQRRRGSKRTPWLCNAIKR